MNSARQLLAEIGVDQHIVIDIEKQHNAELKELAESNTKFISIIAHDLRSPFSTVLGVLALLQTHYNEGKTDETAEFIDVAYKSAGRAVKLLDSLSIWAMAFNAGKKFSPVSININALILEEVNAAYVSACQKNIILNHYIADDIIINADNEMIRTVMRNLIGNAIKFTHLGGKVTITALKLRSSVEISVKDTGTGINELQQKKLFDKGSFYTTSGTGQEKGTGLGLLICKEFIDIHSGRIWVDSEPGKGSEFTFMIPNQQSI